MHVSLNRSESNRLWSELNHMQGLSEYFPELADAKQKLRALLDAEQALSEAELAVRNADTAFGIALTRVRPIAEANYNEIERRRAANGDDD